VPVPRDGELREVRVTDHAIRPALPAARAEAPAARRTGVLGGER
jgi:hypothetical protein